MRNTKTYLLVLGGTLAASCVYPNIEAGSSAASGGVSNSGGVAAIGGASKGGDAAFGGASNPVGGTQSLGGISSTTTGLGPGTGGVASAPVGGNGATGGSNPGASLSTGGADGFGGTGSLGGAPATGGTANTAASTPTGGALNTGGTNATGGSSVIAATGGYTGTGGAVAVGGTNSAGGSAATGGAPATGGALSTGGGAASTGGNTGFRVVVNSPGCGNTALPAACNTSITGACTLNVGGTDRQYFVVLPTNYDPNTAYPIVFLWHGSSLTAQTCIGGGLTPYYGIRAGFPDAIYVAAQGLPSTAGGTDYGWPNTNGQDVNFTKTMINWLEGNYCVDKNRLFSTGFSYGGMMSFTLGCQMPDVFRAIGVMSGAVRSGDISCMKTPIPAWFTHGDADTTIIISGGLFARDAVIQRNGCDTTNTQTASMTDGITTCTIYNACTSGDPVVWCPVPGGTHQIPKFAGSEQAKFFLQF